MEHKSMIRKIATATWYSIVAFCLISFATVLVSLLSFSKLPVTNIGFPFKYYYQFWLIGSNFPNWGWDIRNFLIDFIIIWIPLTIYYLFLKRIWIITSSTRLVLYPALCLSSTETTTLFWCFEWNGFNLRKQNLKYECN